LGGVETGIGLGHGKAALVLATDQRRQHARLLFLCPVDDNGHQPKDVHVHGRSARQTRPRLRNRLHQNGRFSHTKPRPAELSGHGNPKPAAFGNRSMEVVRETAFLILFKPILIIEWHAQPCGLIANLGLLGRERKVHWHPRIEKCVPRESSFRRGNGGVKHWLAHGANAPHAPGAPQA
jgi:hypothetical protein